MSTRNLLTCCWLLLVIIITTVGADEATGGSSLVKVKYITSVPFKISMGTPNNVRVELVFNKDLIPKRGADNIAVTFVSRTVSPLFSILKLEGNNSRISLSKRQLEGSRFTHSSTLRLTPEYIGHAVVSPDTLEFSSPGEKTILQRIAPSPSMELHMTATYPNEGDIWTTIFIISVTILIIISYINLGAQLDVENLKEIFKKPQALIFGFITTVLVMPLMSWLIGMWLFGAAIVYRVGWFIFACCPAASASTLWTVMFNSDKELSIGLQALSTIGSLFTMPALLYFMDIALQLEGSKHTIQVPYSRLIQTQFVLVAALLVGWYFIGRNERAQKISSKVFKPLTFIMLLFIIVFSTIIYWWIYVMFDMRIVVTSLAISVTTYGLSFLLGFLASFNLDRAVAISISSTYKNSGIAFAVLLVAFESPDTYINYVPCLTQVLATSITLYLVYLVYSLVNCIRRRNQPDPIQATVPTVDNTTEAKERNSRSGSRSSEKSTKDEENDEFIAMNVTDVVAGSPEAQQATHESKGDTA